MIRVENINTVMSLACFQSFSRSFNTSVRVASQVLDCFLFFFLYWWFFFLARLVNNCGHSFGLLPSSQPVLNTCVRNVEPCFCPSPCLYRSGTENILNHDRLCHTCYFDICAQIGRTSSRAVLCVFSHSFIRHPLALFSWLLRIVAVW